MKTALVFVTGMTLIAGGSFAVMFVTSKPLLFFALFAIWAGGYLFGWKDAKQRAES